MAPQKGRTGRKENTREKARFWRQPASSINPLSFFSMKSTICKEPASELHSRPDAIDLQGDKIGDKGGNEFRRTMPSLARAHNDFRVKEAQHGMYGIRRARNRRGSRSIEGLMAIVCCGICMPMKRISFRPNSKQSPNDSKAVALDCRRGKVFIQDFGSKGKRNGKRGRSEKSQSRGTQGRCVPPSN